MENILKKAYQFVAHGQVWGEPKKVQLPPPAKSYSYGNIYPELSAQTTWNTFMNETTFNGEKNPYELGNPEIISLDYYSLQARAWQAYLKTDFVQNAIRKYILWIVGAGLKLQAEPNEEVLKLKGINIDLENFTGIIESQFRLFATTLESTYDNNQNLHDLAVDALMNALLAGDVLMIQRFDGKNTTTQIIDGGLVNTPLNQDEILLISERGNTIIQGIELNKKGTHIAYYIQQSDFKYERITARQKDGTLQAWLMKGLKSKENEVRGMSLLAAVLETAAKMDRYKDATLTNAEQSAKFVASIEHDALSDGSNPMLDNIAQAMGKGVGSMPESVTDGDIRAPKIAEQVSGTVLNMGAGQKLVKQTPSTDQNFESYFNINIDILYATLGIPPEVAMDKFGGAYSGSRASLKSWEYKIFTDRVIKLDRQFYGNIFNYWLNIQVLQGSIQADGYLQALYSGDFMILAAYRGHRFIGSTVPHIDPVKEVTAERLKLGKDMMNYPLESIEQAMENLNTGDVKQMINKRKHENKIGKEFLIVPDTGSDKSTE